MPPHELLLSIPQTKQRESFHPPFPIPDSKPRLFERALERVRLDWNSLKIWDKYIQWQSENDASGCLGLFERALAIPMVRVETLFPRFQQFANARPEPELSSIPYADGTSLPDKRVQYIAHFQAIFQTSQQELVKRAPWENEVQKRTYFHYAPMSDNDLQVWHSYLSFEEAEGNEARIVQLYERCIITCVSILSPFAFY